jgi:hypothetical protein
VQVGEPVRAEVGRRFVIRTSALGLAALGLAALGLAGCAATFAPPPRGELDFAAVRLPAATAERSGGHELRVHAQSPEGGVYQLGWRHAVGPQDLIESFIFAHPWPGRRNGFLMAGAGYRRLLAEPRARLQPSLGLGAAAGAGGQVAGWSDELTHRPAAIGGYVDFGVAWRCWGPPPSDRPAWFEWALTFYASGRAARSMAWWWGSPPAPERSADAQLPPVTDWAQGGGGLRLDAGPLSWTLDLGLQSYSNRTKDDHGGTLASSLGWRW